MLLERTRYWHGHVKVRTGYWHGDVEVRLVLWVRDGPQRLVRHPRHHQHAIRVGLEHLQCENMSVGKRCPVGICSFFE
jgi:hypothetical protein